SGNPQDLCLHRARRRLPARMAFPRDRARAWFQPCDPRADACGKRLAQKQRPVRRHGDPPLRGDGPAASVNLLAAFARRVAEHPERVALIDPKGRSWTYAALDRRGQALAVAFAERGLREGDRVLVALGIGADLYAGLAALWRLGAVAVLPEPALGLAGIRHAMASTRPSA